MEKKITDPNKRLLIISYVYPPIAYGGSFRNYRLSKYLSRIGYNITVLTINIQKDLHNDFQLLSSLPVEIDIKRTITIDPWRSYQKIKHLFQGAKLKRILGKISSTILFFINQPDHMVFWVPFAVWKGKKLINKKKINVIYTSSPPHSSQLIGFFLKKLTGVQWIADLRDPITGNIGIINSGVYTQKIHNWLERLVCLNADRIVVNTEYVRKDLKSRFESIDVTAVHNSFDPEEFSDIKQNNTNPFTIAHIGSLYSFRKIDSLLNALERIISQKNIGVKDLQFRLVGLNDPQILEKVTKSTVSSYISIENMVPHEKALQIMKDTNLLVLIKGFGKNSGAQIPGKLFEYLGSGKKILYIGPDKAEAADIIRDCKAGYIVHDDPNLLAEILMKEYLSWHSKTESRPDIKSCINNLKYTSNKMAEKIHNILQETF